MPTHHKAGYELRVVLLLGLAYGFAFYDRMTMSFLSPFVVEDFRLNNTQVGALGSGLSLTWALGAYVFGRWSDKTGKRKPFLLAAMLVFSACSILSGLSTGFWTLLASRIIMGAAEGPFLPICLAIIAAASVPQRRGLNSGIVQNGFGSLLGNALAPLLVVAIAGVFVTWLSDRIGRRPPMIVFGFLMALCPLAALAIEGNIVLMTGLMFIGWIGIGIFPLFMGVIPGETLAYRSTAAAMGIVVAIGEIVGGVGAPLLAGWIADQSSLVLPLAIQAGMGIGAGLFALALRETNPAVIARREAVAV